MTDENQDRPPRCACGAEMVREVRPVPFTYRDRTVMLDQPGWYCPKGHDSLLTVEDALVTEAAFMDVKAEVEGSLPAQEVRRIRKKLKLTQSEAGLRLGGGPAAFNKYERRREIPSRAMANLLRLLDRDPGRLKELDAPVAPGRS